MHNAHARHLEIVHIAHFNTFEHNMQLMTSFAQTIASAFFFFKKN